MATSYSASTNFASGTDAAIRDWAGKIAALFQAGGWVQTSDTGQTAAAALTAATTGSEVRGYQIWRMADALEGTAPVFVKIEFGSGSAAANPGMWVTVGTGSNGTGTLTGVFVARTVTASITGNASVYFVGSASTSRICFFIGLTHHFALSIERTKDASGADTSDGILIFMDSVASNGSTLQIYRLARPTGNTPPNSIWYGVIAPSGTTWALGANVGVSPLRFFDGKLTNPCINAMCYLEADIPALSTVPVSIYGVTRTYFTIGTTRISYVHPSHSNSTLALLYE